MNEHYSLYNITDYPFNKPELSPGSKYLQKSQYINEKGFEFIAQKIIQLNINLKKGDIVVIHFDYCYDLELIFNGDKLIHLYYNKDISGGMLPKDFKVIESEFPINYWDKCYNDDCEYRKYLNDSFHYNNIVWFNHNLVKEQCLANIHQYDGILSTKFKFNNLTYTIYLDMEYRSDEYSEEHIDEENLKEFIQLLSKDDDIVFTSSSKNFDINDNVTLFIPYEFNKF
jgi:hypothetical protein